MTTRRIALLRGINIGRAKRLAMVDLKAVAESLGWTGVRTLLNSGNLVFTAPPSDGHALRLETALADRFGLQSRVTVLTAEALAAVIADNPFAAEAAAQPSRLLVVFPRTPQTIERLSPLTEAGWGSERIRLGALAVYTWHPDGISAGQLAEAVDRAGRDEVTARNWGTVLKLQAAAGL